MTTVSFVFVMDNTDLSMQHLLSNVIVFFFKQKTAYEMRISDWSSDVCSSDLPAHRYILGEEILDVRDAHRVDRGRVDRAGADAIHANAALGIGQPGDACHVDGRRL